MTHGLLLFAHGARDPRWAAPFEAVAARVRARAAAASPVRLAFLEFMAPDLADGRRRSWPPRGCTQVDVVPLFLGTGGHVRKDLPLLLDALARAPSRRALRRCSPPIGEHRRRDRRDGRRPRVRALTLHERRRSTA